MNVKSIDRMKIIVAALVLAGLLIGGAGYMTVVSAQKKKIAALDAQILTAQEQYTALHTAGSGSPTLRAAELFQLSRAMPATDDMPGILVELSRLAASSSVSLTTIQPSPRVTLADGSAAVPLRVTIVGGWNGVAAFLKHVDQQVRFDRRGFSVAGRLFDVDTIQITPTTGSDVQASLTMSAFDYGAPPSPSATAGGPASATTTDTTSTTTTTTPSSGTQQAAGVGSGS